MKRRPFLRVKINGRSYSCGKTVKDTDYFVQKISTEEKMINLKSHNLFLPDVQFYNLTVDTTNG